MSQKWILIILGMVVWMESIGFGQNLPGTNPQPDPAGLKKIQWYLNRVKSLRYNLQKSYKQLQYAQYYARRYPAKKAFYARKIQRLTREIRKNALQSRKDVAEVQTLLQCYSIFSKEVLQFQGQLLMFEGKYKPALVFFEKYLKFNPRSGIAHYRKGLCLLYLMKWNRSLQALSQAKALGVSAYSCYNKMAKILFYQEKFSEMVDLYKKILPLVQSKPTVHRNALKYLARFPEYIQAKKQEDLARKKDASQNLPRVKIFTSRGEFTLELFEDQAPNTVANFISLVEKNFYQGTKFHRVVVNYMAEGGDPLTKDRDPSNDGKGSPGYFLKREPSPRRHFRGSLAMINWKKKYVHGSRFFITFVPCPSLDGRYVVFGRVISGMEVVDQIRKGTVLLKAEVIRKRKHPYIPVVQRN